MADEMDFGAFQPDTKPKDNKEPMARDYSSDIIQVSRRIKVLEEGMNNLRKKVLVNEQNDLNRYKKILTEEKATLDEVNELKQEIENINRLIKEVISELRSGARREDVEVLKKYIDMWNPINFVTEETVEKMIDDKIGKQ